MAYIDRKEPREYPYEGVFSRRGTIDYTKPLEERTEDAEPYLTTMCDIMESSHPMSGLLATANYAVYFPVDEAGSVSVKRGDLFDADFRGVNVSGEVIGVFPSQLDGCTVYIKVIDA